MTGCSSTPLDEKKSINLLELKLLPYNSILHVEERIYHLFSTYSSTLATDAVDELLQPTFIALKIHD